MKGTIKHKHRNLYNHQSYSVVSKTEKISSVSFYPGIINERPEHASGLRAQPCVQVNRRLTGVQMDHGMYEAQRSVLDNSGPGNPYDS